MLRIWQERNFIFSHLFDKQVQKGDGTESVKDMLLEEVEVTTCYYYVHYYYCYYCSRETIVFLLFRKDPVKRDR